MEDIIADFEASKHNHKVDLVLSTCNNVLFGYSFNCEFQTNWYINMLT